MAYFVMGSATALPHMGTWATLADGAGQRARLLNSEYRGVLLSPSVMLTLTPLSQGSA